MFGMGPQELLVVGVIGVVIFLLSGRKASEAGKSLGKSIRELKDNVEQMKTDITPQESSEKKDEAQSMNPLDEIRKELDGMPGLGKIRRFTETTSQIRRFTKFLGK